MTWIAAFVVVALLPGDARAFSCGSDVCTKNVHVCCKSSEGSTHTCETPIDCAPEFWTKGERQRFTAALATVRLEKCARWTMTLPIAKARKSAH